MFNMFKRSVSFDGMDCVADMHSDKYMEAKMASQEQVVFYDQDAYGHYTVIFGCATIGVALLKHVYYLRRDHAYKRNGGSSWVSSFVDMLTAYFRFFGYKQTPVYLTSLLSLPPSAGSALYLVASTLYLSCYCFIPHFWYRGCFGFGTAPLAVRSGVMATALTPFIYILSGKANMVTLFTGISYEKLNYLHQYVGVAALILSVVHTVPFIYQPLADGGSSYLYSTFVGDIYYQNGIPPLILLFLLCTLSNSIVRKYLYEGFLHLHWLMGIAYFGTLLWHVWKVMDTDSYMWAALGFWFAQLIYRALVKTAFRPNALFLRPREGRLQKLEGSSAYQVVVSNVQNMKWKPGQHVFLRFVGSKMLDNHPFSISNMPEEGNNEMKFIILPKKGLTGTLYNELEDYVVSKKQVFVDGPYGGSSRDVTSFDKAVLIGSGSGITAILPFLMTISNHIAESLASGKQFVTKEVNFIWLVRQQADISWIREELNKCVKAAGDYMTIDIYVCSDGVQDVPEQEMKLLSPEKLENTVETVTSMKMEEAIKIHHFKPDLYKILTPLKHSLKRRTFFVSSGSDSTKYAVSKVVSNFQPYIFNSDMNRSSIEEIYLHTENFGW